MNIGKLASEWLDITQSSYYRRIRLGLPLDNGRFSGRTYELSADYLEKIKEKYKNGVTKEILKEMENDL